MAPKRRDKCLVCSEKDAKYSCPACTVPYCSVVCYKEHKSIRSKCCCRSSANSDQASACMVPNRPTTEPTPSLEPPIPMNEDVLEPTEENDDALLPEPKPLRPLTSLRWPYIPDQSAYPDPLKRDDPKALQLHHYEAIATSSNIRKILASRPNLESLLKSLDAHRGAEREQELVHALGLSARDINNRQGPVELSDDVLALRELAEAVEAAVRGENRDALGLDWDSGD